MSVFGGGGGGGGGRGVENIPPDTCALRGFKSACASGQSDQCLPPWPHDETLPTYA